MIGAYNCTFNKRAIFFYRVVQDIKGYYITKRNWRDLLDAYPTISENFKKNVIEDYSLNIRSKVLASKELQM